MPDYEIPEDVRDQAREAAAPAREAMESPTTAEPVNQPVPDVPKDMSNVPDPYDVTGQEAYRADQRDQAVAVRDTEPVEAPAEVSVEEGVNNMSPDDYDAMLEAGTTVKDNMDIAAVKTSAPQAAPDTAAPDNDISLEPTAPEPQGPDLDRN